MSDFVISPKPAAHVGAGAIAELPAVVRATGAAQVVVVTDAGLAATPVIAAVQAVLACAGFGQITADALDDEVLASTPRAPTGDDIRAILLACAGR